MRVRSTLDWSQSSIICCWFFSQGQI